MRITTSVGKVFTYLAPVLSLIGLLVIAGVSATGVPALRG